ncbi:Crp/Fnr family transcriptional regulator [Granulicella cerasi]|uniref:Crp/Fnr family transcriptional regulator n=1 Tax=Granulicella cerasi TaxID=741063 RepID=A0ABW1ZBJ1_9BACT|nr:Crp/Fnr family transcriptional regulator [Granulicella cerasi]
MPLQRRDCLTCIARGPDCFCHLPHEALRDLQGLGRNVVLSKGQQLMHEGDEAEQVYMVCAGHLKLYASSADGKVLLLRMAGPGDVLGLASAIRGTQQKLTVEALEPCEVKSVRKPEFLRFAEKYREAGKNIANATAKEYETALVSARRLALSGSASAKLASLLFELAQLNGHDTKANAVEIPMPLTHEELGSMCGISRETVTRTLTRFAAEGSVEQLPGRLVVRDLPALEAHFS